jgi:hypothetical protein
MGVNSILYIQNTVFQTITTNIPGIPVYFAPPVDTMYPYIHMYSTTRTREDANKDKVTIDISLISRFTPHDQVIGIMQNIEDVIIIDNLIKNIPSTIQLLSCICLQNSIAFDSENGGRMQMGITLDNPYIANLRFIIIYCNLT